MEPAERGGCECKKPPGKGGRQAGLIPSLRTSVSALSMQPHWGPPAQAKDKGSIVSSECHSQGSRAMKCAPRAG